MILRRKTFSHKILPEFRASLSLRSNVGVVVCCLLACSEASFAQQVHTAAPAHAPSKGRALSQQERVLHALNRFTFGPRPEDAAIVKREGLNAWFAQQLHPESLPDREFEARLAQFPAMQLPQADLFAKFPSPEQLRQYSRGALSGPENPTETAIYADAALRSQEKKQLAVQRRQVAGQTSPVSQTSPAPVAGPRTQDPVNGDVDEAFEDAAVSEILALPPSVRFARLVAMSPEQMQAFRSAAKGGRQERVLAGLSPVQAEEVAAMQSPAEVVRSEAVATRLLRDVYSDRQLQAVMTDFWLNHFNVYLRKDGNEPYFLPAYERDAVLPHALGRFEDLLVATAQSPAMLVYLDNWTSMGPHSRAAERQAARAADAQASMQPSKPPRGINENYARELMELHTLGVNGGYTQQDVIEVAKCFTGWTVARPAEGGGFTYDPNWHEPGPKTVLGHLIPESGEGEGLAVLHLLASSPATAKFLSTELAQRFVSDTPSPKLVDRMTATYLRTDGDVGSVLNVIFQSPEFWSSTVYRAKVKTPLEFVASALRASGAEVSRPQPLIGALGRLGMPVYGMQTPNGYSWQAEAWVSSNALLTRMNFALTLSGNRVPGTRVDWATRVAPSSRPAPDSDTALEQQLETSLLGEPAAEGTRAIVLAQAGGVPDLAAPPKGPLSVRRTDAPDNNQASLVSAASIPPPGKSPDSMRAETMAGLLLGSPDFQRR